MAILAASRRRAPYAPRGAGDPSARAVLVRALTELGLVINLPAPAASTRSPSLPRISVQRPRPGHQHPAGRADILGLLAACGEECLHGLRSIELRRGMAAGIDGRSRFARLVPPGRIVLFDQPRSPWRLPGRLHERERARLARAGAIVHPVGHGQTVVTWPGATLRDFMLHDVLLHELGHHLLQHATGKRLARIARTRDHEAAADRRAARWRERIAADGAGRA